MRSLLIDKVLPGVNFRYTTVVINHDYLLVSLEALSIDAARGNAFAHTAGGDIEYFSQSTLLNGHTDLAQQSGTIRDILLGGRFAVAKETGNQVEQQQGDNQAAQ